MISNNGLRLSYRTIPTSTFEIIQNLHLLEVLWFEEKSYWEDPNWEIFWVIATIFRKDIYKEGNVGIALDPYFICKYFKNHRSCKTIKSKFPWIYCAHNKAFYATHYRQIHILRKVNPVLQAQRCTVSYFQIIIIYFDFVLAEHN
jgi:hypothetical protein